MTNLELSRKIKEEMKKQNLTQSDIAKALGVNRSDINLTLKNLSNGKSITTKKLFLITEAINKKIIFLDK